MKRRKSFIALLLVFVMLLAVPAQTFGAARASIKLDKKTLTVVAGRSAVLKATVTGASRKVIWKSSNTAVAQVSSSGRITAKKAGRVTISATANKKTAKCTVTVKKAPDYVKQGMYKKEYAVSSGGRMPASDYVYVQKLSNGRVKFVAEHYGVNASPIYYTNIITSKVINNKASFKWEDSWGNSGKGILTFGRTSVKLQMKTTEYGRFNRWGWWESVNIPYVKKLSTADVNKEFNSVQDFF